MINMKKIMILMNVSRISVQGIWYGVSLLHNWKQTDNLIPVIIPLPPNYHYLPTLYSILLLLVVLVVVVRMLFKLKHICLIDLLIGIVTTDTRLHFRFELKVGLKNMWVQLQVVQEVPF